MFITISDRRSLGLWAYVFMSIGLHILIFCVFHMFPNLENHDLEKVITVFPVDLNNQRLRIADIDSPDNSKKPVNPQYIGEMNSTVTQETVSTSRSESHRTKLHKKKQSHRSNMKRKLSIADLYNIDERLFSNQDNHSAAHSQSADNDFFPDIKRGIKTALNVMHYPNADYFVRIKRIFRRTFSPRQSLIYHFSKNERYSNKIVSKLIITVDAKGNLNELFVEKSSGIPGFDSETLRTVRSSAPFAKPPKKFLTDDGLLRMNWSFTVYF